MKKKIAIVSLGYFWFPCESGTSRFFQIANTFVDTGYEVEAITTDFQHFNKAPRDQAKILAQGYPFQITFIHAPAYKKNIDIRRVYSNHIAEKNVRKYLHKHIREYDGVYASIPANNIAAAVAEICRDNHVPCVLDIEDLWPEAMANVIPNAFLRSILLHGFVHDAECAYSACSGIIGTSQDYTDRAFRNQMHNIPSDTVYVGVNLKDFDEGVKQYSSQIDKPDDEFWVTYAGSISTSYDIHTAILAAQLLEKQGIHNIRFQILGTGSLKEELAQFVKEQKIQNVAFWGFVPYPKMAAVLAKSDLVLNSFVKGAAQSIVNKVGDYLASGKPMINTLENPVFCQLVDQNHVGTNIEPGDEKLLANTVLRLQKDKLGSEQMGKNARKLAEKEFDRAVSYARIVKLMEECIHASH